MKATAISLFLILIPFASALDLSFDSPESANLNESFSVKISAATSEIYDVKIIIQDNLTKATLSEIYNDGWKNPYYYIKSAFPARAEFSVRAIQYSDNAQLCTRLRKIGTSSFSEKCSEIRIIQSSQSAGEDDKTDETKNETREESAKEEPENNSSAVPAEIPAKDFTPSQEISTPSLNSNIPPHYENDKILLTPKNSAESEDFITKEEKIRLIGIYAFSFFTVCMIILLAFRKL